MLEILLHVFDRLRPLRLMRWLAVAVAAVALWILLNLGPLRDYLAMGDRLQNHRDANTRLELERSRLQEEQEGLERGDFPAEKAARERLQMSKPGEKVYHVEPE